MWLTKGLHLGVVTALALSFMVLSPAVRADDEDLWPSIKKELYGSDRSISEEDGTVKLDAPYRAEDAAIVPLTITMPATIAPDVKSLTLVIDKNPAPVVASFKFGEGAGLGERKISTRVRVDMYSNVRAIIETQDGKLHMTTKFVKAAGGCSAPALKDMDAALANIGKMKLRSFKPDDTTKLAREAQVMVRHPNYSGMQMNQLTGLYIPAKYLDHMVVRKGDKLIFEMEGGISLSENPNIRFTYAASADGPLSVTARDTDGKVFTTQTEAKGS
ncbi:quinoprotein dehydrogenase-associated SoxYZ-like carrier [Filomicrobium sp.]|uniref:quinoprotein dehydrogenase-associated SoxYZ-like carrier n=1 Tax=Filomicrobium sp. TaxID=2024831 RepID=UPI0025847951|nr:quinoprotein dehydrogenase-associated SoxYZ-like carrier [Filomicrobium sp.]